MKYEYFSKVLKKKYFQVFKKKHYNDTKAWKLAFVSNIFKYFLKSPKKRIIRVCLNRIERMSLLCFFGPIGPTVDLINFVFLFTKHEGRSKAKHSTIFFFGVAYGCLCFWSKPLLSFLILPVPSKAYMWNFKGALREMMIWSPFSNPTTWRTFCQPC
jgi:hypothetical protein